MEPAAAGATAATDWVIERCRAIEYKTLSDEVMVVARQCVLDWLGVTVAGAGEPLAAILKRTVPGGTPWDVAFVNGAIGHALDYDDTHTVMGGHPTVPVLPAVLAL